MLKDRLFNPYFKKLLAFSFAGIASLFYLWLVLTGTTPPIPSENSPLLLYSNQDSHGLDQVCCEALKRAKKSILLQMYAVSDPDIIEWLIKKKKEGLSISLFYDPKGSLDLPKRLKGTIDSFPVISNGLMHRKICIIDEAFVFLGSANMTSQSLRMHDNLIIGIYHPPLAGFLASSIDASFHFSLGEQAAEAWLLPDREGNALTRLLQLLQASKKNIRIAMFTLTHPDLANALIEAHRRGVLVEVAVDFYTAKGASLKTLDKLQKEGISIYMSRGQQLLHHKWAYIDESLLVAGSANWTRAAFQQNQECFLILSELNSKQKRMMNKMWKILKLESN